MDIMNTNNCILYIQNRTATKTLYRHRNTYPDHGNR